MWWLNIRVSADLTAGNSIVLTTTPYDLIDCQLSLLWLMLNELLYRLNIDWMVFVSDVLLCDVFWWIYQHDFILSVWTVSLHRQALHILQHGRSLCILLLRQSLCILFIVQSVSIPFLGQSLGVYVSSSDTQSGYLGSTLIITFVCTILQSFALSSLHSACPQLSYLSILLLVQQWSKTTGMATAVVGTTTAAQTIHSPLLKTPQAIDQTLKA